MTRPEEAEARIAALVERLASLVGDNRCTAGETFPVCASCAADGRELVAKERALSEPQDGEGGTPPKNAVGLTLHERNPLAPTSPPVEPTR